MVSTAIPQPARLQPARIQPRRPSSLDVCLGSESRRLTVPVSLCKCETRANSLSRMGIHHRTTQQKHPSVSVNSADRSRLTLPDPAPFSLSAVNP